MKKWELFIWVPSKGWKLIGKFKTNLEAHKAATEWHPLETKVSGGKHKDTVRSYFGGIPCQPEYESKNALLCGDEYLAKYVMWSEVNANCAQSK